MRQQTNAAKRAAVRAALKAADAAAASDREIARRCGVSQPFVGKIRRGLSDNGYQSAGPRRAAEPAGLDPEVAAVLDGRSRWAAVRANVVPFLQSMPAGSVDLIMASPPYCDARTYGRSDVARGLEQWVKWMLRVTTEAVRVSRGLVLWVAAGVQREGCYWPAPELLIGEWFKRDNTVWQECIWHKNGLPGTGGKQRLRNDWEFVLAFTRDAGPLPWADNTAMGAPPKYAPGGELSHRRRDGGRVDGKARPYRPPKLANPGNVIRATVGGGHMGSKAAHGNEAPYPENLVEFFVRSYCPPGGIVCDPFCGSGTTLAVAVRLGRRGIGCDLRGSQVKRTRERVSAVEAGDMGAESPRHLDGPIPRDRT